MASDNTQCRADGDCLTKHNLADVCDLMVLISVDNLWKYEYGSDLAIFPALAISPSSTFIPIMWVRLTSFKYFTCYRIAIFCRSGSQIFRVRGPPDDTLHTRTLYPSNNGSYGKFKRNGTSTLDLKTNGVGCRMLPLFRFFYFTCFFIGRRQNN
jgi:hypothetical protein